MLRDLVDLDEGAAALAAAARVALAPAPRAAAVEEADDGAEARRRVEGPGQEEREAREGRAVA